MIEAKTRVANSPYYQINPSGRVPYLVDDSGVGMEDSQVICAYLDSLDGEPRFHDPRRQVDWDYQRLEFAARNMCEGICVWVRELYRPENERSPTVLAHEAARGQRMADVFEERVADPRMRGELNMARLILAVALDFVSKRGFGDLTTGRPRLAAWMRSMSDLPSMQRTVLHDRNSREVCRAEAFGEGERHFRNVTARQTLRAAPKKDIWMTRPLTNN